MTLLELTTSIVANANTFTIEADKLIRTGNKTAGERARKISLQLEKQFKEFRKLSVKR